MAYDLGDIATPTLLIRNAAGVLENASAVTATITLPDGVTTKTSPADFTVTNTAAGTYVPAFPTTVVGAHRIRWVATGTNSGTHSDTFEVRPAGSSFVSLPDTRTHLGLAPDPTVDDQLRNWLDSACTTIESNLGRPISRRTVTERHAGGRCELALRRVPCPCTSCADERILSVTSVTENGIALTPTDYDVDDVAGILSRGQYGGARWACGRARGITVVYVTGYTVTPPWARDAALALIEIRWQHSQQARHTRGGAYPDDHNPATTFALPYAVESYLTPHMGLGI